MKYTVLRDLPQEIYFWLPRDVRAGEVVHSFHGVTYGCVSPSGQAVTFTDKEDEPFYEMPQDALRPIREE